MRAGVISAIYYMFLVFVLKTGAGVGAAIGVLGFVIMLPLGYFIDRWRYRRELRRWEAKRSSPR